MAYLQETILPYIRDYSGAFARNTVFSFVPQSTINKIFNMHTDLLEPYVLRPLSSLVAFSTTDLVSFCVMVIVLYLSLRILDYARRIVMFWVMLVFRLAFWASALGLGLYVYNVGVARAMEEAGWALGIVQGFVEEFMTKAEGSRQSSNMAAGGRQRGGRGLW